MSGEEEEEEYFADILFGSEGVMDSAGGGGGGGDDVEFEEEEEDGDGDDDDELFALAAPLHARVPPLPLMARIRLPSRRRRRTTADDDDDERRMRARTRVTAATPPPPRKIVSHSYVYATTCVICLATFSEGEAMAWTTCGHSHHLKCLLDWHATSKATKCPTCRADASDVI